MKISITQALGAFTSLKPISYEKLGNHKFIDIYAALFPIVKKYSDMQKAVEDDRKELGEKYAKIIEAAKNDDEKAKAKEEYQKEFYNCISAKALNEFLEGSEDVELPTLTKAEWVNLGEHLSTIGELGNFAFMLE